MRSTSLSSTSRISWRSSNSSPAMLRAASIIAVESGWLVNSWRYILNFSSTKAAIRFMLSTSPSSTLRGICLPKIVTLIACMRLLIDVFINLTDQAFYLVTHRNSLRFADLRKNVSLLLLCLFQFVSQPKIFPFQIFVLFFQKRNLFADLLQVVGKRFLLRFNISHGSMSMILTLHYKYDQAAVQLF